MATHTAKPAELRPGARAHTHDGLIGTVERIEGDPRNPTGPTRQAGYLIVRAEDQQRCYRVPRALVRRITGRGGRTTVHLDLATAALSAYLDDQEATSHTPEAPAEPRRSEQWSPGREGETLTIPLASEELTARAEPVTLGTVHLHKSTERFEYRVRVPLRSERVVVERIPAEQFDAGAPRDPDEIIVPIMEERPVLRVETVVREYLRVRKEHVSDERDVSTTLRRERLDVTQTSADDADDRPLPQHPEPPDTESRPTSG